MEKSIEKIKQLVSKNRIEAAITELKNIAPHSYQHEITMIEHRLYRLEDNVRLGIESESISRAAHNKILYHLLQLLDEISSENRNNKLKLIRTLNKDYNNKSSVKLFVSIIVGVSIFIVSVVLGVFNNVKINMNEFINIIFIIFGSLASIIIFFWLIQISISRYLKKKQKITSEKNKYIQIYLDDLNKSSLNPNQK